MDPAQQINTWMLDIIQATASTNEKISQIPRCSSLSKFCQIAFLIQWIEENTEESFLRDFFCEIGKGVHATLQKWWGAQGKLYGQWECPTCKKIHQTLGTPTCCGGHCVYKEFELAWRDLTGHCDGITFIDNKAYILEFKTTSTRALQAIRKAQTAYDFHIKQVNMYTLMAQKLQLPMPLVGGIIIYITRDNPFKFHGFVYSGVNMPLVQHTLNTFNQAKQILATGDFSSVQRSCSHQQETAYCPYKSLCFKDSATFQNYLKALWNLHQKTN